MAPSHEVPTCNRCSKEFTQKSSLVRHLKLCAGGVRAPPRQKACRQCADTKVRCDLQRPTCGRCEARSLDCKFPAQHIPPTHAQADEAATVQLHHEDQGMQLDEDLFHSPSEEADGSVACSASSFEGRSSRCTSATLPSTAGTEYGEPPSYTPPEGIPPKFVLSNERRQVLLGAATKTTEWSILVKHTMQFVIRVLKSWPRAMATYHTAQLPPVIHPIQVRDNVPTTLANCFTLAKMWAEHTEGSMELVQNTILQEVHRILGEYTCYREEDLLAAAQSLLIMTIMLLFGMGPEPALPHPLDAQLLIQIWDVKQHLAATGVFLPQESTHTLPEWRQWAMVSAKRRTILAFHHVEWAWSLQHGYPILSCFELAPLPAPAAKHLWRETDESKWELMYLEWLRNWKGGFYQMMEFFYVDAVGDLTPRTEMWLAEADEYGMMLMAEVNANGIE
ncbi:uncharacterized protein DNG_03197 [Cephalotrichum gorgonifer]|uniref:Zn(2)-C6 fungal-type domain-containing protein n=1 Tax=Cephalotrichum gorgonifer TaxID=2041049 RepID=A0AAE8SU07_9PEZI|nr:uncharacterized protein DNG_03197 [Cephalotrichum gorgonifer]